MKTTIIAVLLAVAMAHVAGAAEVAELEQAVRDAPTTANRAALAEAYLHECQLEQALGQWRAVLIADPAHPRARAVVERLIVQALPLDRQLEVLDTIVERGITAGTADLLDAAAARAASDAQRARILFLRGRLAERSGDAAKARERYETALRLLPGTAGAGQSAIALAGLDAAAGQVEAARRGLAAVAGDAALDGALRQRARLHLVLIEAAGTPAERAVAVSALPDIADPAVRREQLRAALALRLGHDPADGDAAADPAGWSAEAVDTAALLLAAGLAVDEAASLGARLLAVADVSQDRAVLARLQTLVTGWHPTDAGLARLAAELGAAAALGRVVVATDLAQARELIVSATAAVAALPALGLDAATLRRLQGRAVLVEAQKLAALAPPAEALPAVVRARDHHLAHLGEAPVTGFARLAGIGRMLEHLRAWDAATDLYRLVARTHPETEAGRDALLQCARLELSLIHI
mgnify:CR=1 FL=1